jgi:hypothetical protein
MARGSNENTHGLIRQYLKNHYPLVNFRISRTKVLDAPSGNGYTKIYSTERAFAAVKVDGSITAWGDSTYGGTIPTSNATSD